MNDILLHKYLQNEASEREIIQVLDWLDADPKNQQYLDELDYISNIYTLTRPALPQTGRRNLARWKEVLKWSAGAAAVLLLSVGLGYWFADGMADRGSESMVAISVPEGQRMSITLGDGTLVWLNSGTTLEYPAVFPKNRRQVRISGEALFDVEHDRERPFIVETFACQAEVLGTKFNIYADPERSRFSASLIEGRLKVSNLNADKESIVLAPDEMVDLVNGHLKLNRISSHDDFLWVDGLLNLNNLSFEEVMSKFEKYYGVDIVIETSAMPQMKYKGKLRVSDGVDYALQLLQLTSDFSYERNEETNTIHIK